MNKEEYNPASEKEIENSTGSFFKMAKRTIDLYGFWGSVSRYIMMLDEFNKFVNNPKTPDEKHFRKELLNIFSKIHKNIPCAHSPFQFALIAQYILNLEISGPLVECGCFKGGSTAKLSLLAKHTNRKLYVFDSFQGLPEPENENEASLHLHSETEQEQAFHAGQHRGTLNEVKNNIREYGCLDVCEFIPGFYSESLTGFNVNPAFVFIDVDLVSSARDCLKVLWPLLKPKGYFFTHEAIYPDYIEGILDKNWWQLNLNQCPPVIYGAGGGLSSIANAIAYMRK